MFQSFSSLNQWIMANPTDVVKVSLQRLLSSGAGAEGVMRGIPADYARRYALVQRLKYASDGTPSDLTPEEQQTVAENTIAAARAELKDIKSTVDAIQPFPVDEPIQVSGVKQYHWQGNRYSQSYSDPIATLEILETAGTDIPTVRVTIKRHTAIAWADASDVHVDGAKGVEAAATSSLPSTCPFAKGHTAIYMIGSGYYNGWNVNAYALAGASGVSVLLQSSYNTHEPGELSQHYALAISDMQSDAASVDPVTGLYAYAHDHVFERPIQLDVGYSQWEWFPTRDMFGQTFISFGRASLATSVLQDSVIYADVNPVNTASKISTLIGCFTSPVFHGDFSTEEATLDVWNWIRSKIDRTASALEVLEDMPIQ